MLRNLQLTVGCKRPPSTRWPFQRCLATFEGDHLVLVPVPARWGYKRHHTPRTEGLEPVGTGSWALELSKVAEDWLAVVGEWLVAGVVLELKTAELLLEELVVVVVVEVLPLKWELWPREKDVEDVQVPE